MVKDTGITKDSLKTGLSFDDVLVVPKHSELDSRSDVSLNARIVDDIHADSPIISAPMDTVTSVDVGHVLDEHGGSVVFDRYESPIEQAEKISQLNESADLPIGAALGVTEDMKYRVNNALDAGADYMVLTVAHADTQAVVERVTEYKRVFDEPIVVGNVVTADAAIRLAKAGADCIKVGIGPGSFCTTRTVTGVGYPQITAISNVSVALRRKYDNEERPTIIADGGIKQSGDAVKSLVAGADSVMMGGFFTGTEEAPGEVIENDGEKYKIGRGMASKSANLDRSDKSQEEIERIASEGEEMLVEYEGPLENKLVPFLYGIRNGISYVGAGNIDQLHEKAEFVGVTSATKSRNNAHKGENETEQSIPETVLE